MSRTWRGGVLVGSVALIVAATLLPFGGMRAEVIPPSWCLQCGSLWLTDAISNVAMFVPFGVALGLRRMRLRRVALLSLAFSVFIETMQSIGLPPGRSPALADVMTNTTGGALGALLVTGWRWQRVASAAQLGVLTMAWSAMASVMFALSAYMLTPYNATARSAPAEVTVSPLRHVPGRGWYEGITDSARIGETRIVRGWSGPIIQQLSHQQLPLHVSVTVRGNDPLGGQIPLLFLHMPNDSAGWLQLTKRNDDAELVVSRMAFRYGLTVPALRVSQAFAGRTETDARTLTVSAHVSRSTLAVATTGAFRGEASLSLVPTLGWALIQPIITVQSSLAPLAEFLWLWALLLPIGFWGARAARPLAVTLVGAAVVALVLWQLPTYWQLHPLRIRDWTVCASGILTGSIAARAWIQTRARWRVRQRIP